MSQINEAFFFGVRLNMCEIIRL